MVAERASETGIRLAPGSSLQQAMQHIGVYGRGRLGLGIGRVFCAGALRAMRSVVYGVGVYDIATIRLVVLTLAAVTLLAATIPTLRVARIDRRQLKAIGGRG